MSRPFIISSLHDWTVTLTDDIRHELASQHGSVGLKAILKRMKVPPATTICRVNLILGNVDQVLQELFAVVSKWASSRGIKTEHVVLTKHALFHDTICIDITQAPISLFHRNVPLEDSLPLSFSNWPTRSSSGWPMTHRVVMCDRFCGEAVLRGSDIFCKGIMSADIGITKGEEVAVYANINGTILRAQALNQYQSGSCIFLGLGTAARSKCEFFRQDASGVGVTMSALYRVGPILPPLHGILSSQMMLQNLPSIVVGHVLSPQRGDTILDMCAAPGGKTSHLASLVGNDATIVACDKSRKKVVACRTFLQQFGATCVTPLAMDSSNCIVKDGSSFKTVKEVLESATPSERDGLLNIKNFHKESFDRIMLDPPCSALGLRPKLKFDSVGDFDQYGTYQQTFVSQAVALLKPGGFMTYSTCTFNALENEDVVAYLLREFPIMELVPIELDIGKPALAGRGLTDEQCQWIRRFDPSDTHLDTMGFFVAKFVKKQVHVP